MIGDRQIRGLLLVLGASALLSIAAAIAGPHEYLFHTERLCDTGKVFCIRGSLSYLSNPRILHLRARVQTAPGPGLLRIRLAGQNELGHRRHAPFEVQVRGHYSEIINHKMIPDHPDVQGWAVERAVSAPGAVLAALGEPDKAGLNVLLDSPTLTIFAAKWTPQMNLMPHDHLMWANIGIYTGREDNIFWEETLEDEPSDGDKIREMFRRQNVRLGLI